MFQYRAFGFRLRSNIPLPGLKESDAAGLPELRLHLGMKPEGFDEAKYPHIWYESPYRTQEGVPSLTIFSSRDEAAVGEAVIDFWLRYEDGTNIVVGESASRIWVAWPDSLSLEDAGTYLLGPVMAIIAQLRGTTCLHGSAVAIDGRTVVLLGPQGAGKSTTAAAFAQAGYPVVSDDLILLVESGDGFLVEPSYPVMRLWPSSVEVLFGHEDALPWLTPTWNKRGFNLSEADRFQSEALPLGAIYVLNERSGESRAPFVCPLSGAEPLLKLICNSWAHYAARPSILAAQLRVLTKLSKNIPMRQLTPHKDHAHLPKLLELIDSDARGLWRDFGREVPRGTGAGFSGVDERFHLHPGTRQGSI